MLTTLVDYEYYSKIYGGSSIPESSFKKEVIDASSKINYYTSNRINKDILDDNIKNTTCEIAELIYSQNQLKEKVLSSEQKEKASETVGPHSVTYINKTSYQEKKILSAEELEYQCYQICLKHLALTGLMYRGF
ncbi:MAG: hypothetical protein ACI31R_05680 [Bacilli bacterium]